MLKILTSVLQLFLQLEKVPFPIARHLVPNIVREATDAITLWETRINLQSASVEINDTNGTQITVKIEWTLKGSNTKGTTTVNL